MATAPISQPRITTGRAMTNKHPSKAGKLSNVASAAVAVVQLRREPVFFGEVLEQLFYLDCLSLLERGATLTDARYVATKDGLAIEGLEEELEHADILGSLRSPLRLPATVAGVPSGLADLAELNAALEARRRRGGLQLRDNPGWQVARSKAERREDSVPINMLQAMQQLGPEDPWLSEPLTPEEEKLFQDGEKPDVAAEAWDK